MSRTGPVEKPEGHADGCIYDFAVNRDMQAGRSGPAHSRDDPFTFVFQYGKAGQGCPSQHLWSCSMLLRPRSLHFLSPYRAQGTGTGNYYSIIVNGKR